MNKKTTLVVGATGATGRLLVRQLLERGELVKAVVRAESDYAKVLPDHENLNVITGNILDFNDNEVSRLVEGCDAIASCLGHNMNLKGIYGQPRRLVIDTVERLSTAVRMNNVETPVKFVLMNTTGNSNRDLSEKISFAQTLVIWLLRIILPPHVDNEEAADYLRAGIKANDKSVEWVAVRPDGLVNEDEVSEYEIHPSPTRSAIFDAGKISRINVAHFMAELITDKVAWDKWQGQMPVIYNQNQEGKEGKD
jgi:hypothetical protein